MSEHKTLEAALAAFQADAPKLAKTSENPHFRSKFTPLDTIVETIQPLLKEHGLAWTALPGYDENTGHPTLEYRLIHAASGQALGGTMPLLLQKNDPQGLGSALTYSRRYALSAVLNLVSDDDDDGNQASSRAARPSASSPQPTARAAQPTETPASAKQRGLLNGKASEAKLSSSAFARAILTAAGQESRGFESEDAAQQWVNRQLDRLPARLVDKVLAEIENEKVPF